MTDDTKVTIPARFAGPPSSGNGGYTAGLLAEQLALPPGCAATVSLRRPPPLDTSMTVTHDGETARLVHHELVAEAMPGEFTNDPVDPVAMAKASDAETSYRGLVSHPFPTCFVCGPAREVGDGLRLSPGLYAPGRTACVWTPSPSLATDGEIAARFVWSALDCPGGWTSDLDARPLVLGRMTAAVMQPVSVGAAYVVVAKLLREDGRKTYTVSTLYRADDPDAEVIGQAEHLWIAVDPARFA